MQQAQLSEAPLTVDDLARVSARVGRVETDWRSRDLIEVLPAAVYVCDAEAVVVAYNRRAAELWGREPRPGDTDQKYCGAHRLYRPDGTFLPHHETPMEAVLRTGQPARDMEVVIERPDGSRITVLVNIAPLFGQDGRLVGAVNCFQDLTVQKEAELERTRFAEALYQAKKTEALGHLTSGISHDFNNILTIVTGQLELIRERVPEKKLRAMLDRGLESLAHGEKLVQHLLAFARREPVHLEMIDLRPNLLGIVETLTRSFPQTKVNAQIADDLWPVFTDKNLLESAILNLAINARDAMSGSGTLTVDAKNAHLENGPNESGQAGDFIALSISDIGTGMAPETLQHAFEPFYTTKGPGTGTGLGLSMVHDFAVQCGGAVTIQSEIGQGTSITIYLPRAAASAPSSA